MVASVARLVSVHNASYSDDSTYSGFFISLWKVLEITFGIICGCLPAVKAIIKPLLPKALLSSRKTGNHAATPARTDGFSELGYGRAHSQGEVDLQPMVLHPRPAHIKTSVVGNSKRASESEEWIIDRSRKHHKW